MKNRNLTIKILRDLLDEFRQELKEIDDKLNLYKTLLREDKEYLDYLMNQESEDYMIFSPRNVADIHKNEIKEISLRREQITNENSKLIEQRNLLIGRVEKLETVLKNLI